MTRTTLVIDDTLPVPDTIAAQVGLRRFGDLLRRRHTVLDRTLRIAEHAGYQDPIVLRDRSDGRRLATALRDRPHAATRHIVLTTDLTAADDDHLRKVLAKLAWSDLDVVVRAPGAPLWSIVAALTPARAAVLLDAGGAAEDRAQWWREQAQDVERLPDDPHLACLSDPDTFGRWLSGALDTRAFNAMRAEGRTLVKRSADADKMKREHDWYTLLPPALQRFAVQPYDLQIDEAGASYRMERLRIPDAAIQWVHGEAGLPDDAALILLDAVFDWIHARPVRKDPSAAAALDTRYFQAKVDDRMTRFLGMPKGRTVDGLLRSGGHEGGLEGLVQRLHAHRSRLAPPTHIAIMHGDPCLSNILFDKRTGMTRLIDPRGALSEDELWGPATYDLAKLSHSFLGGYDFVNQGLFDVVADEHVALCVQLQAPPRPLVRQAFAERVQRAGFDLATVRTHEASLFLSMLPLHAEAPRKCLGFALVAADLLDRLDAGGPLA